MISIKEFFDNPKALGIRCKNQKEAKKLCCAFSKLGYKWCDGDDYIHSYFNELGGPIIYTNAHGFIREVNHSIFAPTMKVYEIKDVEDFNFKSGDKVRIRGWKDMINEYGVDSSGNPQNILFTKEMVALCGREFTVSHISYNFIFERAYVVTKEKLGFKFDITTDIIEKVYDDKDNKSLNATTDGKKTFDDKSSQQLNKAMWNFALSTYEKLGTYSFRFNEERRNVSLYKYGERVQLVKSLSEDIFDWMIGLGCALYREIYKGFPDVEYIKNISNEKDFYYYCVARFFEFDLRKIDILNERVKTCKREHCEFQITKLRDEEVVTK